MSYFFRYFDVGFSTLITTVGGERTVFSAVDCSYFWCFCMKEILFLLVLFRETLCYFIVALPLYHNCLPLVCNSKCLWLNFHKQF